MAGAEVSSFAATDHLDEDGLRALLAGGQPEQRAWAAWRLALRTGRAHPEIAQHIAGDPSPGVRALLLSVLAGHGELDVVVALARHDPAIEVRASAMRLLTRFAAQGAIDSAVVREAFARDVPAVRAAILDGVDASAPDWLEALVLEALSASDPAQQLEALAAAVRCPSPKPRARAARWLAEAKAARSEDALRVLEEALPAADLVELVRHAPYRVRETALRRLGGISISLLGSVAIDGDAHCFRLIRQHRGFPDAPGDLLARGILSGCAVEYIEKLTAHLRRADALAPDLEIRLPALRAHCHARLAAIEHGQLLADERPDFRWPARQRYSTLLGEIERRLHGPLPT